MSSADRVGRAAYHGASRNRDCYVAVANAPSHDADHAPNMARFALDVLAVNSIMPHIFDDSEIGVRIGVHCGPVITGVIRADRPRWQIFGDTMNTTSRIEATSKAGKVQVSQAFRDLLLQSDEDRPGGGTFHMVQRDEPVNAKGKDRLTTYWLQSYVESRNDDSFSTCSSMADLESAPAGAGSHDEGTESLEGSLRGSRGRSRRTSLSEVTQRSFTSTGVRTPDSLERPSRLSAESGDSFCCDGSDLSGSDHAPLNDSSDCILSPTASEFVSSECPRVMVVHDRLVELLQLARVLKQAGYEVDAALSCAEALRGLRSVPHAAMVVQAGVADSELLRGDLRKLEASGAAAPALVMYDAPEAAAAVNKRGGADVGGAAASWEELGAYPLWLSEESTKRSVLAAIRRSMRKRLRVL